MNVQNVFIFGAGASRCYGFPTGGELLEKLRDPEFSVGWTNDGEETREVRDFSSALRRFQIGPVDLFIDQIISSECKNLDAIVRTWSRMTAQIILNCEQDFAEKDFHFPELQNAWIPDFHRFLRRVCNNETRSLKEFVDKIAARNTFITFNYDRLIEYIFLSILSASFQLDRDLVMDEMRKIRIAHVHGICGSFFSGEGCAVFGTRLLTPALLHGKNPSGRKLFDAVAKMIKPTAMVKGGDYRGLLHEKVFDSTADSVNLIFVGFGFDVENLKKIGMDESFADRFEAQSPEVRKRLNVLYTNKDAGVSNPFDCVFSENKEKNEMLWSSLRSQEHRVRQFSSIDSLLRDRRLLGL